MIYTVDIIFLKYVLNPILQIISTTSLMLLFHWNNYVDTNCILTCNRKQKKVYILILSFVESAVEDPSFKMFSKSGVGQSSSLSTRKWNSLQTHRHELKPPHLSLSIEIISNIASAFLKTFLSIIWLCNLSQVLNEKSIHYLREQF